MLRSGIGEPKKRVMAALTGAGYAGRVSVISAGQTATLEQMNRTGVFWPEAHYNADQMAKLASAAHSILRLDAVRVPFCQTVEAEALGCQAKTGGMTHVPGVASHPLRVGQPLRLPSDLLQRGRLPVLLEAVRLLKGSIGNEVAIIGGVTGPFTLAGMLLGIKAMLTQAAKAPDDLLPVLESCTQAGIAVGRALAEAGADVICVEDMGASAELISSAMYVKLAYPCQCQLFSNIQVPSILHICGDVSSTIEYMATTGATVLSYEGSLHGRVVEAGIRERVLLATGPDPAITLATGTAAEVERECTSVLALGVDILAPGCAIATGTPTANIVAMVRAAEIYGAGK
ncbi:MAG: MtaA/CmuA family methyltransferase [Chloroflexi bacterium]|nr:MtaA/CmuA family methyltransferase [Chloroflexota bacterium]